MAVQPGQIYLAQDARLGKALYARPCLVLRVDSSDACICYFSTKFEMKRHDDLGIYDTDPGFKSTGLKESSYLLADRDIAVELDFFRRAKLIGRIEGELKLKIEEWRGEPLH